jgi:2'-5' RNA ligase
MTSERLFVAVHPDAAATRALRALPRPDERGVRWVPEENWHVTLRFLGACDPAVAKVRLAAARLPACRVALGPAVGWLGPQLVVPAAGVDDLAAAVLAATADVGEPPGHRFRGHLTVARTRRGATTTILGHPFAADFDVTSIALVRSQLTTEGARYTTVATFDAT